MLLICRLAVIAILVSSVTAASPGERRVFVVHSYHEDQREHVVEMTAGIEAALKDSGASIQYFHMDTKRRTSEAWKQEAGRIALERVKEAKPSVVISMDDNAQKYFAMQYVAEPGAAPLVFSGVNADPKTYGFPCKGVTGVLERPCISESISLLHKIVPNVHRVVLVSDKSPTTDAFHDYARSLKLNVKIVGHEQPETFDEWKEVIRKYQDKTDAIGFYVCRTIKYAKDDDRCVPEKELMEWAASHNRLPTVGFFDTTAEAGVMCGISVSMREQGIEAGKIARRILEGAKPEDFEVEPTRVGRIQVNLKEAARLGIEVKYNVIRNAEIVIR